MGILRYLGPGVLVISVSPANAEVVFDTLDNEFAGGSEYHSSEFMTAQPFNLGSNTTVTSVTLRMFRNVRDGNPVGTFYLDIYDDSGMGTPGASVGRLGSINADDVVAAPKPPEDYIFDSPVSGLTPNQPYFLVASRDGEMEWTLRRSVFWAGTVDSTGAMGAGDALAIDPPNGNTDWVVNRELFVNPAPVPVWAFARIETVPEPSTAGLTLICSAGLLFAVCRKRRHL